MYDLKLKIQYCRSLINPDDNLPKKFTYLSKRKIPSFSCPGSSISTVRFWTQEWLLKDNNNEDDINDSNNANYNNNKDNNDEDVDNNVNNN